MFVDAVELGHLGPHHRLKLFTEPIHTRTECITQTYTVNSMYLLFRIQEILNAPMIIHTTVSTAVLVH